MRKYASIAAVLIVGASSATSVPGQTTPPGDQAAVTPAPDVAVQSSDTEASGPEQQKLDAINAKYQPQYDAIQTESADEQMQQAAVDLDKGIEQIRKTGGDPATVMTEVDGQQMSILAAREAITELRRRTLADMAAQQAEMEKQLAEAEITVTA